MATRPYSVVEQTIKKSVTDWEEKIDEALNTEYGIGMGSAQGYHTADLNKKVFRVSISGEEMPEVIDRTIEAMYLDAGWSSVSISRSSEQEPDRPGLTIICLSYELCRSIHDHAKI